MLCPHRMAIVLVNEDVVEVAVEVMVMLDKSVGLPAMLDTLMLEEILEAVGCDVCSPKVSLSQGREGKWEWKGTPELTEADLLTRNRLEVRGMNGSIYILRQQG
jgi:hypothetical protein